MPRTPRRLLAGGRLPTVALVAGLVVVTGGAASAAPVADGAGPVAQTLTGEVVRAFAEPDPGVGRSASALLTWVDPARGAAVRVPSEDLDGVPTGATVEVEIGGRVRDEAVADGAVPARDVLAADVVAAADVDGPPVAAAGTVTDPVTVAMVRPGGIPADGTTLADVVRMVDGPVADFWSGQTYGAVRIGVAAEHDWLSTTADCSDAFALWNEATAAVGFTGGPGEHLLLYLPSGAPDCAAGLGTVGTGMSSGGLIYTTYALPSVVAHEFGHNFSLWHSAAISCDGRQESGVCTTQDYGDLYDVMGASWDEFGSLNAAQADRLGLLPDPATQTVASTGASATVTLSAISGTTGIRAVRLVDESRGATVDGAFRPLTYFLEYRPAAGRDGYLGVQARNGYGLQAGVLLRRQVPDATAYSSVLVDPTPSAGAGYGSDLRTALPVGSAVPVLDGAFTVTVSGVTATSATVSVYTAAEAPPPSPIGVRYAATGGATGPLGAATGSERCGLTGGGCVQPFASGSIWWSAATGARIVLGATRDRYVARGAESGPLGYPTADAVCGLRSSGCVQRFTGGAIYASPATGARLLTGAVLARYRAVGAQNGVLGYPTGDTTCGLAKGGCVQHFTGGALYSTAATGTRLVTGAVLGRYRAAGAQNGRLGYPTADTRCGLAGRGCVQHFSGGSIFSSRSTGARLVTGTVRTRYVQAGAQNSTLGYPIADTRCGLPSGGCGQAFQHGSVYWSATTAARVVKGAVLTRWLQAGGVRSRYGYPSAEPRAVAGGVSQRFAGGTLTYRSGRWL